MQRYIVSYYKKILGYSIRTSDTRSIALLILKMWNYVSINKAYIIFVLINYLP